MERENIHWLRHLHVPLFPTSLLNCDESYVNVSELHYLGKLPTDINGIHGETQEKHKT